jgi:hypothetical protein
MAAVAVSYTGMPIIWQTNGPVSIPNLGGLAAGKLQALAIENKNPSVMYAAGGIGPGSSGPYTEAGVFKTTNGGASWQQIDSGLPDPAVDALWMDQSNPSTLVAGTFSGGIFQTTNAGSSWTATGGTLGSTTTFFQAGGTLYAGTSQGVAASTDSGGTWTVVKSTSVPVRALAGAAGALYAGLADGQILFQASSSSPWTTAASPTTCAYNGVWSIAVNPINGRNAFVVYCPYANTSDLYQTTNGGESLTAAAGPKCTVQFVAIDGSSGTLYAACGGSLWQPSDSGSTWSQISGAVWDMRLIVLDAAGVSGNLIVGSDQGLYFLQYGAASWQSLNDNISSSILFGLDVSGRTLLTTAQDFSPISSFDGGATWHQLQGTGPPIGEGGAVIIHPGNPLYAYIFTTAGFQYSTDGGRTFTSVAGLSFSNSGNGTCLVGRKPLRVDPRRGCARPAL